MVEGGVMMVMILLLLLLLLLLLNRRTHTSSLTQYHPLNFCRVMCPLSSMHLHMASAVTRCLGSVVLTKSS